MTGLPEQGWGLGKDDITDFQAVSYLNTAAVHLSNCQRCTVDGMSVRHAGGHGIWIEGGSGHTGITDVLVEDVGAGGVRIGRGQPLALEPPDMRTHHVSVNNSRFLRVFLTSA